MMKISRPGTDSYAPYYHKYIEMVPEDDVMAYFVHSQRAVPEFLRQIPEDRLFYAYAPGKWTLAEVLQHVLDGERIFAYRCLCIARGEQQQLPSFDENSYSEHAVTSHRTLGSFLEEWSSIRQATISLLAHLHEGCLDNMGHAAGYPVQVRALPWIIAGHEVHHLQIIQERYL